MKHYLALAALAVSLHLSAESSRAAFVIQVDVDGLDDGVLTFSPNFSFGGDTTTASQSSPSAAVGLTGGDSIFGGNGVNTADTYVFSYTPSTMMGNVDNLNLAAGTPLNTTGSLASGLSAGASGLYAVYAAWPSTTNVTGGLTTFSLTHDGGTLSVQIDQNTLSNQWVFLGNATLTEGTSYDLAQVAGSNTFVSMRASGVLFDAIPEPSTGILTLGALAGLVLRRRR